KGGVGKTTVSVNLAAALSAIGMRVLLIDFDFINPSLGFHLGLQNSNSGVRSVLMGKSALKSNAVVIHAATGMHVLPGEMHAQTHTPTKEQLATLFGQIEKSGYDIVIVDTPPGFLPEENLKAFGEALIITTPETSATISAARLANHYDKIGLEHILVVNKFKNKRYELHAREMEEVYRGKISATLP
ncbi:MAG: tyrosine-protein kinase family protein, partial [Candidatus Micrarchaeota archaeon]|nr:tyrosine-protein kinase family protein [Candidatus Micrarchaeota archaeon]